MSSNDTQANDGSGSDGDFVFKLYRYTPSLWAAIVAAVVFAILTGAHFWRMFRFRSFYFTAFTIGGLCKSSHLVTTS
jgi:hypothetical protein